MPDVQEIHVEEEEELRKRSFRKKMWAYIKKNEAANFSPSVHRRIPNFKDADIAARRVSELDEFKKAKVIKINPDRPQEPLKLLALEAGKKILVPSFGLKSGWFLHSAVDPQSGENESKDVATEQDLRQYIVPLGLDSDIKVDLLVLGTVCVSRTGYRIGKGEGFVDLEFGIMMKMGAVDSDTTIITTVHDCQIVDDLPSNLFKNYDVPVDIIVTPTQTIYVKERLKRPEGIFWDILTKRRVKTMQILQQLKLNDEKEGKVVVLKKSNRDGEKRWTKSNKSKRRLKVNRENTDSDGTAVAENNVKETKDEREVRRSRFPRRRGLHERKSEGDNEASVNENNAEEVKKENPPRRRSVKARARANIDFSLKLSNIKSDVRVRHLKKALLERGVRAIDITWHGQRGYCYLHFGKLRQKNPETNGPVQVDSIVASLQRLKLGETVAANDSTDDTAANDDEYIIVEPAKPITRIEITDVTAV